MSRDILQRAPIWRRWCYYALFGIAQALPIWLARMLAYFCGSVFWHFDRRGQAQLICNLAPLLPDDAPLRTIGRRNYAQFMMTVIDQCCMGLLRDRDADPKHLKVYDPFGTLKNKPIDDPIILTTVHINWELMAAMMYMLGHTHPLGGIALHHGDKEIDRLFSDARKAVGITTLDLLNAPLASVRWIKKGNNMGIVADRCYGQRGVPSKIGKGTMELPGGPAVLSIQCKAPIVPALLVRRGLNKFTLYVGPRISVNTKLPKKEQVYDVMNRLTPYLERFIMRAPEQWACYHSCWEHDPRVRFTVSK